MSDLDAIEEIFEMSKHPAGKPCHPNQARARQLYAARNHVISRSPLERQRESHVKRTKAPITLAKVNLPDVPAD